MPKEKQSKTLCVDDLRHAEYYEMQDVFDSLYSRSKNGEEFTDLVELILSRENILLAYRNIKTNAGSNTPGVDSLTIKDVGKIPPDEVVNKIRFIVSGSKHGYRPKPVRRKDIPKPNGSTRPLGIPCIWDRLIQQCIKQVMEPICEAKFSENSFGFRPNCSVEHAIGRAYSLMQRSHLQYVVEFDIKGFFDNVNHSKLMRQIWALGIHDKHLIYILKRVLTAPIKMLDGKVVIPRKGTPQGGIISPLLANIVLNELDQWVESQWQRNPVARKYAVGTNKNGSDILSSGFRAMRKSNLKEMYIVRYADDFRIFCRTKDCAERTLIAVTQWLEKRLKLEVSTEKTRVVNMKRRYAEFLGFKMKLQERSYKYVVKSHVCSKAMQRTKSKLCAQAKKIARPSRGLKNTGETRLYNSMVMGWQNYYAIATLISEDAAALNRSVMTVLTNRLSAQKHNRLARNGRALTEFEERRYGKSSRLRYVAGSGEPIYPIGCVQHKDTRSKKRSICCYTSEGRKGLHDNLQIDVALLHQLMKQPLPGKSAEYADNRISLFSAQWGKCWVTGNAFISVDEIHCHHKVPKKLGGTDKYDNLVLVSDLVHRAIHATKEETIQHYLDLLKLNNKQIEKLKELRELAGSASIAM